MIHKPTYSRSVLVRDRFIPPFDNGDRMNQLEFHELYLQTPKKFKAELIGGVVYMASPVGLSHGRPHRMLSSWIDLYFQSTPGTDWYSDLTVILADDTEVQPDLLLRLNADVGGISIETEHGYLQGPPELCIEVSVSSASIDLHAKKADYQAHGVREYLVVEVKNEAVHWFTRGKKGFVEMKPDRDGYLKSKIYPGLWIDPTAVFERSPKKLLNTLRLGLATPEHAKFTAKLQKMLAKKRKTS